MNKFLVSALLLLIIFSFFLYLMALLNIFPLLISIPLLFISFFLFFTAMNRKNRFKGF